MWTRWGDFLLPSGKINVVRKTSIYNSVKNKNLYTYYAIVCGIKIATNGDYLLIIIRQHSNETHVIS